jgi:hypothetical protein
MANGDPAQPMIDWVKGAPPGDLAAELMAGFGPSGPRDERITVSHTNVSRSGCFGFMDTPRRNVHLVPFGSRRTRRYWKPCSSWSLPH